METKCVYRAGDPSVHADTAIAADARACGTGRARKPISPALNCELEASRVSPVQRLQSRTRRTAERSRSVALPYALNEHSPTVRVQVAMAVFSRADGCVRCIGHGSRRNPSRKNS